MYIYICIYVYIYICIYVYIYNMYIYIYTHLIYIYIYIHTTCRIIDNKLDQISPPGKRKKWPPRGLGCQSQVAQHDRRSAAHPGCPSPGHRSAATRGYDPYMGNFKGDIFGIWDMNLIYRLCVYIYIYMYIYIYLVGGWAAPLKNMSSSIGMMRFPIYGKITLMFQTTNQ